MKAILVLAAMALLVLSFACLNGNGGANNNDDDDVDDDSADDDSFDDDTDDDSDDDSFDDDSDDDSDDDIFDDDVDDDSDDDSDDDNCDPAVSTPTLDFHAICHNNGADIDQCEDQAVNAKDFATIADADGWGIFIQYTDNACDLGFYVHSDGSTDVVEPGTECGTGSQSGVFFGYDYVGECQGHAGETIVLADSIQLKDYCDFTSDTWGFTLNVSCI